MTSPSQRVRKAGLDTPEGFLFELSGGHLALDFANTVDVRPTPAARELLGSFESLVNWSRQAGVTNESTALTLLRGAKKRPGAALRIHRHAIRLRETLFHLFAAAAQQYPLPIDWLYRLERFSGEAAKRRRLVAEGIGARWIWFEDPEDLAAMLWPVVEAAVTLLTSEDLTRVKMCEGDICSWLFLDKSQKQNRRWCDMSVCGNREKARRHYARRKRAKRNPE